MKIKEKALHAISAALAAVLISAVYFAAFFAAGYVVTNYIPGIGLIGLLIPFAAGVAALMLLGRIAWNRKE